MRLLTNLAYLRTLGKQVGGMKTTRNVLRKNLDFVELDLKIVQEWLTNNPNPLTSLHTPKKPTFLKSQNAADAAATIMKKNRHCAHTTQKKEIKNRNIAKWWKRTLYVVAVRSSLLRIDEEKKFKTRRRRRPEATGHPTDVYFSVK